jgi:rsbT antagonist protein RsbS
MSNNGNSISVIRVRDILMVTIPADPNDSMIAALQESVLGAMDRHAARGLILDISLVDTLDSYFARLVSETAAMVALMGARMIVVGMRPMVAMTAVQMGLTLRNIETSLNVERALEKLELEADLRNLP